MDIYVPTYYNKYVQYRCISNEFTTNIAYWQSMNTDNNWAVASRASITFPSSTQITIGSGYIYLYKGAKYVAITRSTEETFDLSGNKFLVLNVLDKTISAESIVDENGVILMYHDAVKGFCDGLFYNIYQNKINNDNINIISSKLPKIPYIGYFARGNVSLDSNLLLSISNFDLYTNKNSFYRNNDTVETVQLAIGTEIIWFDLNTKKFSVSKSYNDNSVFVGVFYGYEKSIVLNGIGKVTIENNEVFNFVDKVTTKKLYELSLVPNEILAEAYATLGRINTWKKIMTLEY